MFAFGENAGVGGFVECVAGVAICLDVDRTLKGARPSELPIEQPTIFELIINLKTPKMLFLMLPPMLLAPFNEMIEWAPSGDAMFHLNPSCASNWMQGHLARV
jgi:hypothetical protein